MPERNPCAESGCPAACCRNMLGDAERKEILLKAFPKAKRVDRIGELKEKIDIQEVGVFYFEDDFGWIDFAISGMCPNLNKSFGCSIHSKRYHPHFCISTKIESVKCRTAKDLYSINLAVVNAKNLNMNF